MATLSLYLFNLLPLPYLDGTELLKELFGMVFEGRGDEYDLESLDNRLEEPNRRGKWSKGIMRLVNSTVAVILAVYTFLALMDVRH
jgi:S2P endopeptidase